MYSKFLNFRKLILSALLIVLVSVLLQRVYLKSSSNIPEVNETTKKLIYNKEELSKYDGVQSERLFLAVIGSIFDVTSGSKHYGKSSSYHYFIGKDGTRALVTGNFKDESEDKDHILDLKCDNIFSIMHWRKTFREKYSYVGKLEGRYYNSDGTETNYMRELKAKLKLCKEEKEKVEQENTEFPPCNVSWSEEEGTRVWCSKSSGGIVRNWVGVPRQMFTPGKDKPKCVCAQQETNMLKPYTGCLSTSAECFVKVEH
ncbi:unnamed protein product [Leptosia nina]|uniref:Cytochrome b5 heme-binding domain-containing protein n=1 Tax=Leptosia nina TaxID=320188 RepID=A0AAV1J9R5_9NEOP